MVKQILKFGHYKILGVPLTIALFIFLFKGVALFTPRIVKNLHILETQQYIEYANLKGISKDRWKFFGEVYGGTNITRTFLWAHFTIQNKGVERVIHLGSSFAWQANSRIYLERSSRLETIDQKPKDFFGFVQGSIKLEPYEKIQIYIDLKNICFFFFYRKSFIS